MRALLRRILSSDRKLQSKWLGEYKSIANKKVRVVIIGLGNYASSLIQGVHYYRSVKDTDTVPGLMHISLGGYHIKDIGVTLGIDINATRVGKDLSEAIFAYPNNTFKYTERMIATS